MDAPGDPAGQRGWGLVGSGLEIARQQGNAESRISNPRLRIPKQEMR